MERVRHRQEEGYRRECPIERVSQNHRESDADADPETQQFDDVGHDSPGHGFRPRSDREQNRDFSPALVDDAQDEESHQHAGRADAEYRDQGEERQKPGQDLPLVRANEGGPRIHDHVGKAPIQLLRSQDAARRRIHPGHDQRGGLLGAQGGADHANASEKELGRDDVRASCEGRHHDLFFPEQHRVAHADTHAERCRAVESDLAVRGGHRTFGQPDRASQSVWNPVADRQQSRRRVRVSGPGTADRQEALEKRVRLRDSGDAPYRIDHRFREFRGEGAPDQVVGSLRCDPQVDRRLARVPRHGTAYASERGRENDHQQSARGNACHREPSSRRPAAERTYHGLLDAVALARPAAAGGSQGA